MKRITTILAIAAIFTVSAWGQSFSNLNFELAQNLPYASNGVPVSVADALPYWTAYDGSLALSSIYYVSNNFPGYQSTVELEGGSLALSGNEFSVGLYAESSISQTGAVPVNAESLQFEAYGTHNLTVALGGQNLAYTALSDGPNYIVYGANIPADMDGQMEALTLSSQGFGTGSLLDDIEFSPTSIPEPSAYALICLGAILAGLWRRHKSRRWLRVQTLRLPRRYGPPRRSVRCEL